MVLVIFRRDLCFADIVTTGSIGFKGMRKTIARFIVGKAFTVLLVTVWYRAFRRPYDEWNVTGNRMVSCEDGEYVQGVEYDITILVNTSYPYYLNSINFMCSSSTLGERIRRLQNPNTTAQTCCCCDAYVREM